MTETQRSLTSMDDPVSRRDRFNAWRHTRVGAIFGSVDFLLSIPLGVGLGAIAAYSPGAQAKIGTILLTMAGLMVGLIGVTVATSASVTSKSDDPYLLVIANTKSGIDGLTRPFRVVVIVAVAGCVLGLGVGLLWPSILDKGRIVFWFAAALPLAVGFWAVIGAAQLVLLHLFHAEGRASLAKTVHDVKSRHRNAS